MTIYGYARVSSKGQELKGNSLEEQRLALKANGASIIYEEQYSGATLKRPQFEEVLARLGSGDTLVVTKLDRFARNVSDGISVIRNLFAKGVKVHVLNVGLLENTSMGNFFITTLLAVAELERCLILERTAAGKAIAKTKAGFREGRPPISKNKIALALPLLDQYSYKQVEAMTGISRATLARYKLKNNK